MSKRTSYLNRPFCGPAAHRREKNSRPNPSRQTLANGARPRNELPETEKLKLKIRVQTSVMA